jgi:hypothetical protein
MFKPNSPDHRMRLIEAVGKIMRARDAIPAQPPTELRGRLSYVVEELHDILRSTAFVDLLPPTRRNPKK